MVDAKKTQINPELARLVHQVFEDAQLMSLGTSDAGGVWVADVIFTADDDFNIYWLSKPTARHSQSIADDGAVAAAITACWDEDRERAVQLSGRAMRIDRPAKPIVDKLTAKRGTPKPGTAAWKLEQEVVWYMLCPTRIELIHNEQFDYDRQRVL